jgi:hypothetical protein
MVKKELNMFKKQNALYAALAGAAYGVFCRIAFTFKFGNLLAIMSLGFIVVMPIAAGFISVFLAIRAGNDRRWIWMSLPGLSTLIMLLSGFAFFWEGAICLVLMAPIALVMSFLGGAVGMYCARRYGAKTLLCVAVLPFVISSVEQWLGPSYEEREVATAISIKAPREIVWRQIERVAPIHLEEQRFSWSQKIGFPRPIEATLSGEGVGAVRHATFAGGVLFIETVTLWEPDRRLGFDIRADTVNIPPHTLDEHVTIGGRYFDALHGEYRIEPHSDGTTILHLVSRHRLSTTFNFYSRLWTDAIMRDIQDNILYVVRNRCERRGRDGLWRTGD